MNADANVLQRSWKYAAPPWRFYEALLDDRDQWLERATGEPTPEVAEAVRDIRVVLAPWVDSDIARAEVAIDPDGQGTRLTITLHADHELSDERRKDVRYRLGVLFGDRLRHWVDGW
ncbi:MAG: hypothetical protein M3394_01015 [Actinomycetota bacterium]|nr:hypothetical protein [Actinomycetota bacterium]MDQ3787865.1 hypothetical protein [Actinomycetota bacterium]